MTFDLQTIALFGITAGFMALVWGLFWPVKASARRSPLATHWRLVYMDDGGRTQFTTVRVIKINAESKRMMAWCSKTGSERVFKLGQIVKAKDLRTGARINVSRLRGKAAGQSEDQASEARPAGDGHPQASAASSM